VQHLTLKASCAEKNRKKRKEKKECLNILILDFFLLRSPFRKAWVSKPKETKDWQTEVGQGGENALICPELIHSTRLFATIQKIQ